jgi:glycosyltransferase involved in cell wall biosynthesis
LSLVLVYLRQAHGPLELKPLCLMRILTLTNLYPNPCQPLKAPFNRQLFRALSRQHPLRVIAPILWTDELAGRRRRGGLPRDRRVVLDGMTVDHPLYLYAPKILRHWYGQFYRLSVRKAFRNALHEFRPDIVFAPWAYPDGWAAVELGHAAGLPVVVKVHGSDIRVLSRVWGRRLRTVESLQRADGVVTVSQELARQVIDLKVDPDKVRAITSGINSDLFHPGPRAEARERLGLSGSGQVLLFIGNLVPVKGLDVLVQACSSLAERGIEFTCYLIGAGPLRSALERQIARLGLTPRVQLVGTKANAQLPDWFRAANVFVLPSRSEGLPTVLLEALACGIPFVASRVGGIPELANLGPCRLVRSDDPGQLAEAIRLSIDGVDASGDAIATQPRLRNHDEEAIELCSFLETVHRGYHAPPNSVVSSSCLAHRAEPDVACNDQAHQLQ